MQLQSAPAIRTRRKARNSECDEARIIAQAIRHATFDEDLLPILNPYDPHSCAKPLGWVIGRRFPDRRVAFLDRAQGEKLYCAFTSFDAILAATGLGKALDAIDWSKAWSGNPVVGNYYDFWPGTGQPNSGLLTGSAFTALPHTDADAGAILHGGNVSTDTKNLLAAYPMATAGASAPTFYLYDRVLTYEACTFNAATLQAMTNTLPALRYVSGAPGMRAFIAAQTVNGATAAQLSGLTYVDQAGNTAHAMPTTPSANFIASAAAPATLNAARLNCPAVSAGTVPYSKFLLLASGDQGMRSITNYTTTAANTGTNYFCLCRQLAVIPCPFPIGSTGIIDFVQGIPNLPIILDGACLSMLALAPVATAANLACGLGVAWG